MTKAHEMTGKTDAQADRYCVKTYSHHCQMADIFHAWYNYTMWKCMPAHGWRWKSEKLIDVPTPQ